MARPKKIFGTHPIKKTPMYKKDIEEMEKSISAIRKDILTRYVNVPKITLLHLALAISLGYPTYVTDNDDLIKDADYLKKTYKIQVGPMSMFMDLNTGEML